MRGHQLVLLELLPFALLRLLLPLPPSKLGLLSPLPPSTLGLLSPEPLEFRGELFQGWVVAPRPRGLSRTS